MKIRRKVFFLMMICFCVSFMVAGVIVNYTRSIVYKNIAETSHGFGELISSEAKSALRERMEKNLNALTIARADQLNASIEGMQNLTKMLSNRMTRLASNFEKYPAEYIKYPLGTVTYVREPFILYSSEITNYRSADLEWEISRAANIKGDLQDISAIGEPYKNSVYIASEKGYFIGVDYRPPQDKQEDNWEEGVIFDARQRPWYQKAKNLGRVAFSDVYFDTDKSISITCAAPYYSGDNFAGVVGIGVNVFSWYENVVKNIHNEGKTCFILDSEGDLIFSSYSEGILALTADKKNLTKIEDKQIADIAKKMVKKEIGIEPIIFSNEEYYLSYAPMPSLNWSLAVFTSRQSIITDENYAQKKFASYMQEFYDNVEKSFGDVSIIAGALFFVMLFMLALISNRLAKKFVEPIDILSDGVKEISGGNLDKKIEVNTKDEIADLAHSFNQMTDNLKTYVQNLTKVTAEKEKISTELNVATNIQQSMLPHDFNFDNKNFEIFATMNAAKSVGGDFYDFYLLDKNHLMITIADVSGKGVPAALFMANSKTVLRNFAMTMSNPDDLAAVMACANNQLCQNNDEIMFVTVFMALLDLKTGKLIYVNGGHNPPMIYRKSENKFEYLQVEQNCVLGMMDEMDFVQQETQINHGDIIYLYTDGVTEAMDENNNQYGEERLSKFLNQIDTRVSLEEILQEVHKDLSVHVGKAEQSDDITMLAVRLN